MFTQPSVAHARPCKDGEGSLEISPLTGSILKNQEDTFAAELHRLKQQPLFHLMDFESVVDWIRSTVAEVRDDVGLCP